MAAKLTHRHTRSALPHLKLPFPLLAQSLNEPALPPASSESLSHLEVTQRVPQLLLYPAHQSSRTTRVRNRNLPRRMTVKNPIHLLLDSLPPVRGRVKARNELSSLPLLPPHPIPHLLKNPNHFAKIGRNDKNVHEPILRHPKRRRGARRRS